MALFRKLFHRKPPDGLLEICERLYVFDCCFTTEIWEEENYKVYVGGIIGQLRDHFLDASLLVFNFREEETRSQMAETLSEYDITIMDYPRQYVGCPLLTMEVIHHFLRSSESWLSLGPQNVLLMHCERGGWPVLAFMLAALLIYRKQYTGEHRTLEMVYKQAPHELLQLLSPLNPLPSQLRYLQYVSRRNVASEWPPLDRALTLDCVILRLIPNFGAEEGCRPIFRVYGHDPFLVADRSPKVLYSTPKRSKTVRLYKQAECELVKIDINCHIQGDVVLECISLNDDMEREEMMFRAMFNTAFVRSNILILNRDEIDTLWNAKDQFPKEFRAEVLFSEMDAAAFSVPDDLSCFAEKEGLPLEAFAKVQEIFSHVDWLDPKTDAALNVLHHITTSNIVHEKLDTNSHQSAETIPFPQELSPEKFWEKQTSGELKNNLKGTAELENNSRSPTPMAVENLSAPSLNLAPVEVAREKKVHSKSQQAVLQPPSQSEKICQQTPQSNPVFCNSVQSTPVSVPRCHSAPSAFGLSPLFQADASSKSVEVTYSRTTSLAVPPLTPDMSCIPTSTEQKSISILPPAPPPPSATACSAQTLPSPPPPPPHFTASKPTHPSVAEKPETHLQGRGQPSLGGLLTAPGTISPCKTFNESLYDSPFPVLDSTPSPPKRKPPPTPPPPPMMTPHRLPTPRAPSPPPTPHLKESPAIRAGPPPPPPPPPPVMTPPTLRTPPPPPPPPLKEGPTIRAGPPPPPPPPPMMTPPRLPTPLIPLPPPPLKDSPTIRAGPPPPPPPPPMMTPPRLPTPLIPLPPPPLKDSPTIRAGPPPPPPPPLRTGKAAGPSISSLVPPPPPTPTLNPALHNSKHVPSAPPPPVPFGKGFLKTDAAASESPSAGNNKENGLSRSPSRGPSFISSGTAKGRGLSRTISPRNHQIKKLKPLHWLKLTRAAQGSLWAEAQKSDEASKAPEIDMSELESLFSVVDSGGKSSLRASGPKSDKVQLIDHRRAYNCEIMLSKVKVSLHDLMSSVLALDDSALDVDQVDNLIKFCPTKEEMELLKGYNGEKEKLGKCEQFFLELMQVPRVESKLRVFSFKIQFRSQVSDLRTGLNVVNSAAEEMRNSVKLKRIMQTILSLGNALNQGTARGSAIGFRLDSLLKLTDTRAKNNKMTLMHYLCKVVADKLPELLDFSNDLGSLESASKIQLKFLAEEMQAVSKGLDKVVQELSLSENDGPVSETFRRILKEFLCVAEAEVRSLASLYSGVGKHADALILYFGEDPSRCPFEQVVSTLHDFVRMFKHAHEENCKQLVLEKKAAEKESDIKKLKIAASA